MRDVQQSLGVLLVIGLICVLGQIGLGAEASAAPSVGKPVVTPASIPVGQATQLTVTSRITGDPANPVIATGVNLLRVDANNKVIATIGVMRDDGTGGDATSGDGIFILRFTTTEATVGELRVQVSAAFKGVLKRVLSEVTIVPVGQGNVAPVAQAGDDANATVAIPFHLDGSESYDPDKDVITFRWTVVERPAGSTAVLTNETQAAPDFTPDAPGLYTFELVVHDGKLDSPPDHISITVVAGNAPPNARAGKDQTGAVGVMAKMEGSTSDDPNQTALIFLWTFDSVPAGSTLTNANLSARTSPTPQFTPDIVGVYRIRLQVGDGLLTDEDTVQVTVSLPNVAPNANAGPDQNVKAGAVVTLDGSLSADPDNGPAPLSFSWAFVSRPATSVLTNANITNASTVSASFTPDVEGFYLLRLAVTDSSKKSEDNVLIYNDATLPTLQFTNPTDGATIGTRTPTFTVTFSDTGSGLDLSSYRTFVNGVDVTGSTQVTPTGATYTPGAALPAGDNTATARIADRAGNLRSVTIRFTISVFRAIADCGPTTGDVPLAVRFRTRAEFTGGGIVQYRWDFQGDGAFDTSDSVARDYSFTFQKRGTFNAKLDVTNNFGDHATDTCTITVGGGLPVATADATPSNGPIPLTVTFSGNGFKQGGSIVKHEWDFEGDGIFDAVITDFSSSKPTAITFIVNHADCGSFDGFQFFLNDVLIGTQPSTVGCICNSQEPSFTISDSAALANWNVGGANILRVDVGASTYIGYIKVLLVSPGGSSSLCMFDGIGNNCVTRDVCDSLNLGGSYSASTADAVGSASKIIHTYSTEGVYNAVFRVTDNEGLTATASAIATAVRARPPGSPTVIATGSSTNGVAPLNISFNGSATDDGTIVKWEWDFEGDGVFDFSSTASPATSFTYTKAGVFGATLQATDNAGLTSTDVVEIAVGITASLSIPDDTIDPTAGETATIDTSISAEVPVRLVIKNEDGSVIRTLVNGTRAAGSYADVWDGKDDRGQFLPQAPYFAVLEYVIDGKTLKVDLTNSTGGDRYNPSRNGLPSTFRPYEDDHLTINFTLPNASEVQAFVGLFNTDTRFVTLLDRVPLGAGTHTIKWDGLDANGNFAVAPPGDTFLFGIWGFSLSDNAIFLKEASVLSNVTVDPNYFDPATSNFLTPANPTATIKFDLNKAAEIEVTVTNLSTGFVLRRIRELNVPAGTGRTMLWDGRADDGLFVDRGDYRLAIRAIDSTGSESLTRYALVRVFY